MLMPKQNDKSFMAIYRPVFNESNNEWTLRLSPSAVVKRHDYYEIRLPLYASRALAVGGNILRPIRKKYRDWLLKEQGNVCVICGEGPKIGDEWNLDHQPPLAQPDSRFIDYEKKTNNRVIHHHCDPAQISKRR
jgi:hypothetical protein